MLRRMVGACFAAKPMDANCDGDVDGELAFCRCIGVAVFCVGSFL